MANINTATLKISLKCDELLNKIKSETGASKKFVVEKAVEEYYKNLLSKKER